MKKFNSKQVNTENISKYQFKPGSKEPAIVVGNSIRGTEVIQTRNHLPEFSDRAADIEGRAQTIASDQILVTSPCANQNKFQKIQQSISFDQMHKSSVNLQKIIQSEQPIKIKFKGKKPILQPSPILSGREAIKPVQKKKQTTRVDSPTTFDDSHPYTSHTQRAFKPTSGQLAACESPHNVSNNSNS